MDERCACSLIAMIRAMVVTRDGLRALAVCGSWARGAARPESDLDLLLVAADPAAWRREQGWVARLPYSEAGRTYRSHRNATYGVAWSAHIRLDPEAALELTFAPVAWAHTDPVDPGTRRVVSGGFRVVIDKDGALARLVAACETHPLRG